MDVRRSDAKKKLLHFSQDYTDKVKMFHLVHLEKYIFKYDVQLFVCALC